MELVMLQGAIGLIIPLLERQTSQYLKMVTSGSSHLSEFYRVSRSLKAHNYI